MKDRRINGCALELIMRDVMDGMRDFTHQACTGSDAQAMDILGIEPGEIPKPQASARIIPFPLDRRNRRRR